VKSPAFPVTGSTPSAVALARYLPAVYSLGEDDSGDAGRVECFFAGRGWGDGYLVQRWPPGSGEVQRYFLKVYAAAWRTIADIRFELDFIQHLDRKGLAVALPLPGRDGSLVHSLELPEGERSLVLFHAAPGRPLSEQPAEAQSHLLGGLAAQLHEAAADFSSPHPRSPLDLDHLLDLSPLGAFAAHRGEEMAYLQQLADRVRAELHALPLAALRRGVCHGDLGGSNVLLEAELGGRITLIDFDDCGPGWHAYDLGHLFMFWHLFHRAQAEQLWQTFLAAYRSRTTLDAVEVAAAPAFALARLLQVHAHDNPLGALRDRWPASVYVDGTQWEWLLQAARTLESHLPRH
jgi:Ser/Thr protein kinase RdoA (MazF antagonist)